MDYYAILRVPHNADDETIRQAYRRLAREFHPDLVGETGSEQMKQINAAYHELSDPKKRREYDILHGIGGHMEKPIDPSLRRVYSPPAKTKDISYTTFESFYSPQSEPSDSVRLTDFGVEILARMELLYRGYRDHNDPLFIGTKDAVPEEYPGFEVKTTTVEEGKSCQTGYRVYIDKAEINKTRPRSQEAFNITKETLPLEVEVLLADGHWSKRVKLYKGGYTLDELAYLQLLNQEAQAVVSYKVHSSESEGRRGIINRMTSEFNFLPLGLTGSGTQNPAILYTNDELNIKVNKLIKGYVLSDFPKEGRPSSMRK